MDKNKIIELAELKLFVKEVVSLVKEVLSLKITLLKWKIWFKVNKGFRE